MHGSSVVLVALVTSALTATGTTYLIQRYRVFPPVAVPAAARQVAVPNLVGLSEADARANAEALELALVVEGREPARGVPAGTVLRQSLPPSHLLAEHGSVGVVFALALPTVPKVTGLTVSEAEQVIIKHGYKPAEGSPRPSLTTPAGQVVEQLPEADAALEPGGAVTVHVSSGPAEVVTPALSGLTVKAAQNKLSELGLELKVRWISKAETVTGSVLSQKPSAGEKLAPKSTVEVVVNR